MVERLPDLQLGSYDQIETPGVNVQLSSGEDYWVDKKWNKMTQNILISGVLNFIV